MDTGKHASAMPPRSNTTALWSRRSNLDARSYERRCRLDGGEDEDGTVRLPNVDVVPAPVPLHVLRERAQATVEGRAMRHPYRGMPLTGAPPARFPQYLLANQFDRYADLDENGHDPQTIETGALEHAIGDEIGGTGCNTGWVNPADLYITDEDGKVQGFRKADGSMASKEELEDDARRYSSNFAADTRFCHVYNHSHECKATCFKNTEYKKPSAEETPTQRTACRFRYWRLIQIFGRWLRRLGKALVAEPTVAAVDDADNEFGRCKVCRANCFRGSSQDLCQVCLRCNVDYQYQIRTFPQQEICNEATSDGAPEHTSVHPHGQKQAQTLPGILGWLVRRASTAKAKTVHLLASFAVGMRSSAVADFYATKYLAKPQQWLTSARGP